MRSYFAAFLQALVLCALLTPLIRALALRLGAVSTPGGRNVNSVSVPRLGGIAIALSALAPLVTLYFVVDSGVALFVRQRGALTAALLLGGFILCGVGVVDDTRGMRARSKIVIQVAVAVMAYYAGFKIDGVMVPFFGPASMGIFGLPITVLWIVGVTNAVNLIDGLDGLAAGIVFCAAVTNLIVSLATDVYVGSVLVGLLMASLMGALVAFLVYNFNPARIYMGDSGSYFLGYILATSSLMAPVQKTSTTVSLLVPMLALGLPIFDTFLSIVRRYLQKRSIFSPDRGHLHHRLLDLGITHRRAVLSMYAISFVLSAAAVAVALGNNLEVGLALIASCVVLYGLIKAVSLLERARISRGGATYDAVSERLRRALPDVLYQVRIATNQTELKQAMTLLQDACEASRIQFVARNSDRSKEQSPALFAPQPTATSSRRLSAERERTVTLSFTAPPSVYSLEVTMSGDEQTGPHSSILLQLAADAFGRRAKLWSCAESPPRLSRVTQAPSATAEQPEKATGEYTRPAQSPRT